METDDTEPTKCEKSILNKLAWFIDDAHIRCLIPHNDMSYMTCDVVGSDSLIQLEWHQWRNKTKNGVTTNALRLFGARMLSCIE